MHIHLERVERASNCFRFFGVSLEPNLFQDTSLVIRWGRIGTRGTIRIRASGSEDLMTMAAASLVKRKLRRGYRPVSVGGETTWAVSPRRARIQTDRLLERLIASAARPGALSLGLLGGQPGRDED